MNDLNRAHQSERPRVEYKSELETSEHSECSILLRRIREHPNDPIAWESFFRQYRPRLTGYFCKFGLNHADAEELTQDVFTRIHRNVKKFDSRQGTTRTWIFTIAYRMWVDVQRKWKNEPKVWLSIQNIDPQHFANEIAEQYDETLVDDALESTHRLLISRGKNGRRDYDIFLQNWRLDRSREEIAQAQQMSVAAVGMVILRIQRILKEELKKLFGEL